MGSAESLSVKWQSPVSDGGETVDKYKIEWDTELLVEEIQSISVVSPVTNEIQVIRTSAAASVAEDEIQIIRVTGTAGGI